MICYILHIVNDRVPLDCIYTVSAIRCVFWHLCAYLYSFIYSICAFVSICPSIHLLQYLPLIPIIFSIYYQFIFAIHPFKRTKTMRAKDWGYSTFCHQRPHLSKELTKVSSQEFGSYFPSAMQLHGNRRQRYDCSTELCEE